MGRLGQRTRPQTWEYSPEFALRSYAFVGVFAVVARAGSLLYANKVVLFFALRMAMATWSAFCEATMYRAIADTVDSLVAVLFLVFIGVAPGFFVASTGACRHARAAPPSPRRRA